MVAHADIDGDHVSTHPYGVAPIIKYMAGWKFSKVKEYCTKKKWTLYVYEKPDDVDSNAKIIWPKGLS
jgi:hypothetical protein